MEALIKRLLNALERHKDCFYTAKQDEAAERVYEAMELLMALGLGAILINNKCFNLETGKFQN